MKYQLRKGDTAFAIGQTNFSESKGSLIDTNGCIALSVISGYAIATINGSLKFEITAKRLYAASQRVL